MNPGELLVVMWHYIVPPGGVFVGDVKVAGEQCSLERFKRQLKALKENFNVISTAELLTGQIPEKAVLLTFDDGLKNQFCVAFPILQEMRLPAVFSVMVDPFTDVIPATFKLQLIGGEGAGIDLWNLRNDVFPKILKEMGLEKHLENIQIPEGLYRIETQPLREIKFICNMRLKPEEKIVVVGGMFNMIFSDREYEFCQKMFMSFCDTDELKTAGMEIASHGISHHFFDHLLQREMMEEVQNSKNMLEMGVVGKFISSFVYPSAFSGNEEIENIVKRAGYKFGFAYDGKPVINSLPLNPFCIRRIHEADLEKFVSF